MRAPTRARKPRPTPPLPNDSAGVRVPPRRRRLPADIAYHDAIDPALRTAYRFKRLRDLPEHPLFEEIHSRIAQGMADWSVAKWVQSTVGDDDPLSAKNMKFATLVQRMRRFRLLLPKAALLPQTYLRTLTQGVKVEINDLERMSTLIYYQEMRVTKYAPTEMSSPGPANSHQGKEIEMLFDMYERHAKLAQSLGLLPMVGRGVNLTQNNLTVGQPSQRIGDDPFTRLFVERPDLIASFIGGINQINEQAEMLLPPRVVEDPA